MLIGTTYAGHDWNTGSMSNQLLFVPRRLRLWMAKGAAVLLIGLVVGAVVLALFWSGAALLASSRDIAAPPGTWNDIWATQVRGVLAIGVGGLLGYALTMLFRSTVATLSLMFGVAIAGSLIVVAIIGDNAARGLRVDALSRRRRDRAGGARRGLGGTVGVGDPPARRALSGLPRP